MQAAGRCVAHQLVKVPAFQRISAGHQKDAWLQFSNLANQHLGFFRGQFQRVRFTLDSSERVQPGNIAGLCGLPNRNPGGVFSIKFVFHKYLKGSLRRWRNSRFAGENRRVTAITPGLRTLSAYPCNQQKWKGFSQKRSFVNAAQATAVSEGEIKESNNPAPGACLELYVRI